MGMKNKNGKKDVVEGFRVLTLLYRMDEIPPENVERLKELFKRYRAIAAMYYWSKRSGLEEGVKRALERAKEELPSYWRRIFKESSPLYAFNVEKMKPRKVILRFPLTDALSEHDGAYIYKDNESKESKLRVWLGDGESLELPVPERALRWLKEKEDEVAPLKVHKTVRIQWRPERAQTLKVQIVFRVQRPRPPQPDPKNALLVYIDVNSSYGIAAIFASFDEERVKVYETLKLRPPNRGRRLKEAAKRERAAARGSKPNANRALARLSKKFDSEGWVRMAAAAIFVKARKRAKGRSILMNFDMPDSESVKESYLQKTLLSIKSVAKNLANWHGVHIEFRCYPSRRCPLCGGRLKEYRTKHTRVMRCQQCDFYEDRDYVPFYWWLRTLNLPFPKHPLRALQKPSETKPSDPEA